MRSLLVLFFFLVLCSPAAQAQKWLRNIFKVPSVSTKTLTMVERRALVGSYSLKVNHVLALNRIGLTAERLPVLKNVTHNYYKLGARHFSAVSVKPMYEAKNTLEDMVLSLPASLKAENVFVEKIPAILKPTEAYLSAMLADAWGNWLESGIGAQPPEDMAVSRADFKHAQALYADLLAEFDKQYAALPAEQKDLRAQLSRVMKHVQVQTGWNDEMISSLEQYFAGVMRPMIAKQKPLTAREFLQAYDVLAVAAEMGPRYHHRLAKGASSLPHFIITESIQRVKSNLLEGFMPAQGSARVQRLTRWYEGLFGQERL